MNISGKKIPFSAFCCVFPPSMVYKDFLSLCNDEFNSLGIKTFTRLQGRDEICGELVAFTSSQKKYVVWRMDGKTSSSRLWLRSVNKTR